MTDTDGTTPTQPTQSITTTRPMTDDELYEASGGGGCKGCMSPIIGMMGCFTLLLIIFGGVIIMGVNTIGGVADSIWGIFDPPEESYSYTDRTVMLEKIQAMSELTTTRYTFSHIGTVERELPDLLKALYQDKLTIVFVGHVDAGIDLQELTNDDIILVDNTLTITLPEPRLHECYLNEQETYIASRDTGLFTSPSNLDTEARRQALQFVRDKALNDGDILETANTNASERLRLFIEALPLEQSITNIQINTTPPGSETVLPDSCR